jgi:hypothetical protein
MKQRTSLAIDERVRRAAEAAARRRGISLSRFITEVLESHLSRAGKAPRFPRSVTLRSGGKNLARDHDAYAFRD